MREQVLNSDLNLLLNAHLGVFLFLSVGSLAILPLNFEMEGPRRRRGKPIMSGGGLAS